MSFSLMIGLGALLGHLYLYRRLVRHVAPSLAWRRAIGALLATMTVVLVLRGQLQRLGGAIAEVYPWIAYGWLALAVCMLVALATGDLVRLGVAVHSRVRPSSPPIDAARRDFLARTLPRGIAVGGGLLAGYGVYRAFTAPEITELAVHVPKLPSALDGLSIVQLTDVHVGPFIGRRFIDTLVAEANAQRPDVVVVTGDLVDGSVDRLGHAVAGLAALRARYGTFFVTGNHDDYSGADAWCAFLETLGIHVLRNRRVEIGDSRSSLDLVGVDDWGGRRRGAKGYDLDAALADRDPDRAAVLLAHQPTNFEVAAERGVDLQISGHTHGGQIFPLTAFIGLGWTYSRGLYHHADSSIYVSRGCGFWGPPARVGSPPEIAKLVLTA
ncbi:MAG TPA: metallophosphoesterase [Nannocystaceae bacterium]|nr:metallophosphoesterase [Nannocystaceae bacterium]